MSNDSKKRLIQDIESMKTKLYNVYDSGDKEETVLVSEGLDRLLNQLYEIDSRTIEYYSAMEV